MQRPIAGVRAVYLAILAVGVLSGAIACSREEPASRATTGEPEDADAPRPRMMLGDGGPAREAGADSPAANPDPDETLPAAIKSRFAAAALVVLALDVESSHGVVTLYGAVAAAELRARAGRIASSVRGVRSVVNNLIIVHDS